MKRFVLTPAAKADLDEIWEYIAKDNLASAVRVLDRIEFTIREITKRPAVGHVREELADSRHRFFPVGSYLIVYRFGTKPLQIVRILHASRDVHALLRFVSD